MLAFQNLFLGKNKSPIGDHVNNRQECRLVEEKEKVKVWSLPPKSLESKPVMHVVGESLVGNDRVKNLVVFIRGKKTDEQEA